MTDTDRRAISSLSRETMNPYLSLLYGALADEGVPRGPDASLRVAWLRAHRGTVRILHAHWPEGLWRWHRGPKVVRPLLAWVKLALFSVRLRLARALGYRIVWTIHQVVPHDSARPTLDLKGARILAHRADVLLAHDNETADEARRRLGVRDVTVVPHGSYVGTYPPGRPRDDVRAELGASSDDDVVALCFGELRSDSDIDVLVDALARVDDPRLRLVVAGNVKAASAEAALARAGHDRRLVRRTGFIPADEVAELYGAADLAVMPRGNGGTSGSLILALSFGVPAVAADVPAYRELTQDGSAGWLFTPCDAVSLGTALTAAVRDPVERSRKARAAGAAADTLRWSDTARAISAALRASERA